MPRTLFTGQGNHDNEFNRSSTAFSACDLSKGSEIVGEDLDLSWCHARCISRFRGLLPKATFFGDFDTWAHRLLWPALEEGNRQ